ncbi:5-formyltetrahydrofolate cyclo-ligase [Mycobacterium sp. ACS4331]|uniref:5-formyltetrahydrofolate cyclo-ligase n=1 Tax=Mycobacterium sp. ACS4331 TaxID=1834121 RepID=UPI000800B938|nr:5-formyltetrahydrofolate cyclo-ligase [Mycobacterium sp. ACS4331]OBF19742.1 5-formyltetrahydrofolate cyclo-ligase [Mycobacterium sp. ACS4331]
MQNPAAEAKAALRRRLLAARRSVPEPVHADEAKALSDALADFVTAQVGSGATVCAYVPVGSEPGSPAMVDVLAATGVRVLLPVVDTGEPKPLRWAVHEPGRLVTARFGLLEPAGPRLPAGTVSEAAVLIIPALAVDRRGVRLGRGAGFYDRSLPFRDPAARLVAVVRDSEFVDALPADPHDVPMTQVATPGAGVTDLQNQTD